MDWTVAMPCLFAGIDLAAGRGTTEVALLELDGEQVVPLFRREAHRAAVTDQEIAAVLVEARPEIIAIDAPLSLPASVAAAVRFEPSTASAHGEHDAAPSVGAYAERPLAPADTSPYTRRAERDTIWSTLGVRPLPVSFLGGLTFRAMVLVTHLRATLPDCVIIEVFPTATLRMLGVHPLQSGAKRQVKTSEAARVATQEGLIRYIAGIPASRDELLGADLLDALAAALTGVAYFRGEYVAVGDADEGQIVLPSVAFSQTSGEAFAT